MLDAVVGFSVNPEIVFEYDSSMGDEKLPLLNWQIKLSGTSGDVAIALKKLECRSSLIGAIGINDAGRVLLECAIDKAGINFQALKVLNETSIAFLPVDRLGTVRVIGKRGGLLDEKGITNSILKLRSLMTHSEIGNTTFRVATGIRPSEYHLVNEFFSEDAQGRRVLNPNREFLKSENRELFQALLEKTDFLIFGEAEYGECNGYQLSDFHTDTTKLIVLTMAENGGRYSLIEKPKSQAHIGTFDPIVYPAEKIFSPGAGDWFLAGLLSQFIKRNVSINELNESMLQEDLKFAARVAGKKVTMPGAGNGPSYTELL